MCLIRACPVPGVAEQFAIAEAKLRAWSSVDGDDSNDESYDEDFMPSTESSQPTGECHGAWASVPTAGVVSHHRGLQERDARGLAHSPAWPPPHRDGEALQCSTSVEPERVLLFLCWLPVLCTQQFVCKAGTGLLPTCGAQGRGAAGTPGALRPGLTQPRCFPTELTGTMPASALLRDLLQGHLCQLGVRHGSCEPESDSSHTLSPETLCSSLCSLEMVSPSELTAKLLGSLGGEDLLLPKLPPPASQSALRGLARLRCQDSLYSVSYTEACLSPAEDEVVLSKDFPLRRKISDVASSGVASLEEEEEEAEEP